MDFLGILDLVNKMGEAKRVGSEMIEPASQMMDQAKFKLADTLGLTKDVAMNEDGGGVETQVDQEAFDKRMKAIQDSAAGLSQFDKMIKPGIIPGTPASPMQLVPRDPGGFTPYAPANYGQGAAQGMFGQQPTYEQLLKALQSRGY